MHSGKGTQQQPGALLRSPHGPGEIVAAGTQGTKTGGKNSLSFCDPQDVIPILLPPLKPVFLLSPGKQLLAGKRQPGT